MAKQIADQVQIDIAIASIAGNITKKQVAEEFNVSPDSVRRYTKKWEEEAQKIIANMADIASDKAEEKEPEVKAEPIIEKSAKEEPKVEAEAETAEEPIIEKPKAAKKPKAKKKEKEPVTTKDDNTPSTMEEIMETLNANQRKVLEDFYAKRGEHTDYVDRIGQRGRNPDGVKSIRQIVMEVLDDHFQAGTLVKDNRTTIIKEIMDASGHDRVKSAKYFSGYKKYFGGYQDQ